MRTRRARATGAETEFEADFAWLRSSEQDPFSDHSIAKRDASDASATKPYDPKSSPLPRSADGRKRVVRTLFG